MENTFSKRGRGKSLLEDENKERILSLLEISEEDCEKSDIKILDYDKEDKLVLLHYTNPNESSLHIRGTIIDLSDKEPRIVCEGFPFTRETSTENFVFDENCIYTKAYEGTILRLFKGKITQNWYLSTHKRLNARDGHWAGPTFGAMFDEIWENNLEEHINQGDVVGDDECWIFLLSHPDNRVVCDLDKSLRLVGIYKEGELNVDFSKVNVRNPNIKPQESLKIKSTEELVNLVQTLDWKDCTGILMTKKVGKRVKCTKFVNENYINKKRLRGDRANIEFRYVQLKKRGKEKELMEFYPEKKDIFDGLEDNYKLLVATIKRYYVGKFVKREKIFVPDEEFGFLLNIKNNYNKKRSLTHNIWSSLRKYNAKGIYTMLKKVRDMDNIPDFSSV